MSCLRYSKHKEKRRQVSSMQKVTDAYIWELQKLEGRIEYIHYKP